MANENRIPYSQEAEMSLLGSVLLDQSLLDGAVELISPEDFFITRNRDIFESMLALHEERSSIDHTTLAEELKSRGKFQEAGGAEYFTDLEFAAPIARNVKEYCGIIRNKSLTRQLIHSAQSIIAESSARSLLPISATSRPRNSDPWLTELNESPLSR